MGRLYTNYQRLLRNEASRRYRQNSADKIKARRAAAKVGAAAFCDACDAPEAGGRDLEMHHYAGYAPEHREDFWTLCRPCHRPLHQKGGRNEAALAEVARRVAEKDLRAVREWRLNRHTHYYVAANQASDSGERARLQAEWRALAARMSAEGET